MRYHEFILVIPQAWGCYTVANFDNGIAARFEIYYLLAAPVELLNCARGAIFSIAARFSSRGGDGLRCARA